MPLPPPQELVLKDCKHEQNNRRTPVTDRQHPFKCPKGPRNGCSKHVHSPQTASINAFFFEGFNTIRVIAPPPPQETRNGFGCQCHRKPHHQPTAPQQLPVQLRQRYTNTDTNNGGTRSSMQQQ